jgi:hypothetical protein
LEGLGKSEGAAAFRLPYAAPAIETALAAELDLIVSPESEFTRRHFSPRCARLLHPLPFGLFQKPKPRHSKKDRASRTLILYGVGTAATVVFDGTLSSPDPSRLVT